MLNPNGAPLRSPSAFITARPFLRFRLRSLIAVSTHPVVFTVSRTSLFIVSVNKYLETINQILSAGIMFKMRFEGVDSRDRQNGCYLCLDSKYFSFWSGNGNLNMLIQSKTNCISQFIYYSGRVHGGANSEGTVGNTQRDMQLLSLNFLSHAKLRTHLFEEV